MLNCEIETAFEELINRIENVFTNKKSCIAAKKYLTGLLSQVERKNGWQLSEALGETTPYVLQQFLYRGRFSADELRDHLQMYVNEKLGDPDGILVVDETGFLKQGKRSCGVKRQYSGTAGRIENCQIGVFLTYASQKGHTPIDRQLYIPKDWFDDKERCKKAGIPETIVFQTKPEMALEMIKQATLRGVSYRWVTGDCVYGDYQTLRMWLEEQRKCYVLCVSGKEYLQEEDQRVSVSFVLKGLDETKWFTASCGDGSKGARLYNWQIKELEIPVIEGWRRCLLVRKSLLDSKELCAYVCFAPVGVSVLKLVEVAGRRWTVERCFVESKSKVGFDQYEVQSFSGWYKHVTFACLAHALLTYLSCCSLDARSMQKYESSSCSLALFKKKRGLLV
ncbi:MAG: IS701 family transposase [Candidatus Bathyarchaeota archaeon]|uniref:IS701 family transposase n=1 Tax=Candidatus Bathycorpusculum sp. TaxID=2994959 RepID=UPI00281BF65E|nr:IS701 family transposase [Candidatus Termiticorpusculum sp.]MCL2258149.1 IS701 family transposase [Candidatus Termiticorpusculum sp.]MCL2291553.1 IS701 family transposase [Candidatus Termiticorpusculum sp.]